MKPLLRIILAVAALASSLTSLSAQDRPNILWLTSEDNGPHLGCYGDTYATTPNIDQLASKGMRFRTAWSNAPVCAPARTTIITGVYPPSLGAENMRSLVPMPSFMRMYPQYLRDLGYYCTNNSKEDYNVEKPDGVWDESSRDAHWKNRREGQPFFAIFNYTISHESQIRNDIDSSNNIHDPAKVRIPAYHPDTPEVRKDWAQYYDRLTMMDRMVGNALQELEEAGLAEDTIIFYYGDHGSGMPRNKRFPYNSGLHVPMIVHFPAKWEHLAPKDYAVGGESERMVAFIDLAPTLLSIAGVQPPEWMQGHAFAGRFETESPEYLHGFRNRMDERYDLIRSTRDSRYVYIRNYSPHQIYGQRIDYMFQTPTTQKWHDLFHAGELNAAQSIFWQAKPSEELYDLKNDPDEVDNLAGSHAHQEVLRRLRNAQNEWLAEIRDTGFLPEAELISRMPDGTPYELARDPDAYPYASIKSMAEIATTPGADALEILRAGLGADDSAIRYWAAMGLLIRGPQVALPAIDDLHETLEDDAPAPRIVAAEIIARFGSPDQLDEALDVMLSAADIRSNPLFVSVQALNAIAAVGPKAKHRLADIKALPNQPENAPGRVRSYTGRLLENLRETLQD